ncbi:hypothetical protein BDY19DRAFT_1051285 [Irpex rosettiformis]|uniref:Uncharacterized protein n=1 Tax=Irpex rosettiformis TaxID=378272 RepID=A0ACB8TQT6_9APHY|nr:hypothetical protein BDY19DRAFT_1051285 [Irpex rosettiformis]
MSDISEIQLEQTANYVSIAANEVDVIWRRKWSIMTWAYASMHYSTVLISILGILPSWSLKVVWVMGAVVNDITWSKTARSYREARRLQIKAPLATLLFRDGTIYFIILLLLNVFQVIESNAQIPSLFAMWVSVPFFQTLMPIIICRFILNLRLVTSAETSFTSGNQWDSLHFVGNAGESLRFGAPDTDEGSRDEEGDVVEWSAREKEPDGHAAVTQNDINNVTIKQNVGALSALKHTHEDSYNSALDADAIEEEEL